MWNMESSEMATRLLWINNDYLSARNRHRLLLRRLVDLVNPNRR